jgi:hypothetical protein
MSAVNNQVLLADIKTDIKLWKAILYLTLLLGFANIMAILFFERFITSHADIFKGFSNVPAIKTAIQLLSEAHIENDALIDERIKKILGIYGMTLLSGFLFGGGILVLGTGFYLYRILAYVPSKAREIILHPDLSKGFKLFISVGILALIIAAFIFWLSRNCRDGLQV